METPQGPPILLQGSGITSLLVACSTYTNADAITNLFRQKFKEIRVVRLFTDDTEKVITKLRLNVSAREGSLDQFAFDNELDDLLHKNIIVAASALEHIKKSTAQQIKGIRDKRVLSETLKQSLGYQLLEVCGLAEENQPEPEDAVYKDFRIKFINILGTKLTEHDANPDAPSSIDKQILGAYGSAYRKALVQFLASCNVIVTTTTLATEPRILDNFKAFLVMIEEAAKCNSLEILALCCAFRTKDGFAPVIMSGDAQQITPTAQAPKFRNAFAAQKSMPEFIRLQILGFPSYDLVYTRGHNQELTEIVLTTLEKSRTVHSLEAHSQMKCAMRMCLLSSLFGGSQTKH